MEVNLQGGAKAPRAAAGRTWRVAALIAMGVALLLAWLPPGVARPDLGSGLGDRLAHVGWGGLVAGLLAAGWARASARKVLGVLLVMVVLSGLLEVSQVFVGRGASLADWGAGVSGAGGVLALWLAVIALKHLGSGSDAG